MQPGHLFVCIAQPCPLVAIGAAMAISRPRAELGPAQPTSQPPTITNFQSFGGRGFGRRPAHDAVYVHSLSVTWPGADSFPGVMVRVMVFLHPYV